MAEYNKTVFVLALILVCWFSGVFSVCRKRCRANNPKNKGCGDFLECRNNSAVPPVERCFELPCFEDNPWNYNGTVSYTESGRECINWVTADGLYPKAALWKFSLKYDLEPIKEASNFCRFPFEVGPIDRPFCYVTGDSVPEPCNIINCAYTKQESTPP